MTSLLGVQQESAWPSSLSEAGILGARDVSPNGGDSDNHIAALTPDPEDGIHPSMLEETDEVWELRQLNAAGALALALDAADVIVAVEAGDGAAAAAAADVDADATNTGTASLPNRAILRGRSSK